MDDLLADFLTETAEGLAGMDAALLKLEQTPGDAETLSLIFRLMHTIKGTCGFLGLGRLERLTHAGENVLGCLRDGKLAASAELVTLILALVDGVRVILAQLAATGAEPEGDDAALVAALGRAAAGEVEPAAAAAPAGVPQLTEVAGAQTIRVTLDVLDHLMTLVSELVLARNQLLQIARGGEDGAFTAPLQRLSRITTELQEGVMKTRMQPIGTAWAKLPRMVRDLALDLGKRIELVMQGTDTELDRQVLELIKDPLTHLVRNCADHGLEPPEQRRTLGKPEAGRITLNAFHESGHIVIEIGDDGRGLATERIRAKALALGLRTEAELAAMTETQVQRFILHAGFSTAAKVTSLSGRGVGMDVVKANVERIGGTIDLRSMAGQGSTFVIKIPLTLAIVSALVVEAGGERFAIPQISVVELVRAGRNGESENVIEWLDSTPVLRLRDRLLPLVGLAVLLELDGADDAAIVVVTQVGSHMLGIVVERVFDTEEIVVKPVAPILRHITVFSGTTILGDGSVIMILDPNGIARASGIRVGGEVLRDVSEEEEEKADARPRTAMLLFRAGGMPMAVPLERVARLEEIPRESIENSAGALVVQYRSRLMPLVALSATPMPSAPTQSVLVFADAERSTGLMVDEIVDVVEDCAEIDVPAVRPGLLGAAIIGGRAVYMIDIAYWLEARA